ncbi:porin [Cupriavidus metallidurans]|uniref:porin n=1 Tax=Cupriavidus metallidurans TaxID=119219 RepID=UPI0016746F6A|nr:porin [Cupriavidus metallidurans]
MRKLIGFAVPAVLLCATEAVKAQSNVTIYGIAEAGIRYSTNANAAKNGKFELSEGAVTASRLGLRGTESLGSGISSFFTLEAGFDLSTGQSLQGSSSSGYTQQGTGGTGRLFGRQAFVGLKNEYGALSFGRQYSVAYQMMGGAQIFGNPTVDTLIIVSKYTGVRQDNDIKYEGRFGGLTVGADYAFGEAPGKMSANSGGGVAVGYTFGGASLGATYATTYSADGNEAKRLFGVAGNYVWGPFKATLGYLGNRYKTSDTRNDLVIGGVSYRPGASWLVGMGAFWDKQRDPGGSRTGTYGMVSYQFSKRTNVYVEADYNLIHGRYQLIQSQGVPGGKIGMMVGLGHAF